MKRDLKADLEAIREGATLFGDPNPGVNTQYELYEVAEHAIERAIKAEAEVEQLKGEIEQLLEIAFAHIPDVMWRHGYYVDANPEEDSEE